jgi:hypothetical protein
MSFDDDPVQGGWKQRGRPHYAGVPFWTVLSKISAASEGPLQQVLGQSGEARPSEGEATNPAHAGIQPIRTTRR